MSLHEFMKIVRQRWIVIVLCVLVAAGVMFAVTPANYDTTPKIGSYTATATLLVGSKPAPAPTGKSPAPVVNEAPASLGRISLFITTGEVPRRAADKLGYAGDPALLASGLKVEADGSSMSITITTTATDGARAAAVANEFAREAVTFFDESPAGGGSTKLTILQEATPIPNASTAGFVIPPDRNLRTALAAALGLLFGLALALILDRLDSRLRTREEVAEALRLPIIGDVPRLKRSERNPGTILSLSKPLSVYADGYRAARAALMHAPRPVVEDDSPRRAAGAAAVGAPTALVVLVSSAHAAEGKTTSAVNLAASFAETGQRVLALDADLRNPDLHEKFDVPQGAGISDYLSDPERSTLGALARPSSVPGVQIVTAGTRLDHPAALTSRIGPLLAEARQLADVVIVETAPLLAASDVFDIVPLVDSIVLVVRSGRLTTNAAHRVSELLGRFRVPVMGAILIGAPVRKADYGYVPTGYGYGEDKQRRRSSSRPAPEATDGKPAPIEADPVDDADVSATGPR